MAYYSRKDITAFTYNSTDLKGALAGGLNIKFSSDLMEFQPAGVVWPTPLDTGLRKLEPVAASFVYDGAAAGAPQKCANGTSATLTMSFAANQSISCTAIVSEAELVIADGSDNLWNVTFTPSGTVTIDTTE